MKTHRPWQPHMGNSPLFNPYAPAGRPVTFDHFDLAQESEQQDETGASSDEPQGEAPQDEEKRED